METQKSTYEHKRDYVGRSSGRWEGIKTGCGGRIGEYDQSILYVEDPRWWLG
jgi:hypothetical protein